MNRVHKADAFVRQHLIDQGLMTKSGWDCIKQLLDPFHDEVTDPSGFCDGLNGNVNVTCVEASTQIVSNQGAVNNWDCHVFTLPYVHPAPYTPTNTVTPVNVPNSTMPVNGTDGSAYTSGYLNIHGVPVNTGLGVFSLSNATFIANQNLNPVVYPSDFRVVGFGFEIYNTTAPLYRQGSLIVYKNPYVEKSKATYCQVTTATPAVNWLNSQEYVELQPIPSNATMALALQNSKQWDATEGCYVVVPMNSVENEMKEAEYIGSYYFDVNTGVFGRYQASCGVLTGNMITNVISPPIQRFIPFHQTGVILQNLSPQTALTLVSKLYIERMPSPFNNNEIEFVRMAKRSLEFDPMALKIYTEALRKLPVGVPVKENALGDWFLDVVSNVAGTVAPYLAMAFPEFSLPIGVGTGLIQNWAKKGKEENKAERKFQQKHNGTSKNVFATSNPNNGNVVITTNRNQRLPQGPRRPSTPAPRMGMTVRNKIGYRSTFDPLAKRKKKLSRLSPTPFSATRRNRK